MAPVSTLESNLMQAKRDTFYLGNPDLLKHLAFVPGPTGSHLVHGRSAESEAIPALLTFFGEISRTNCFVTPAGHYNPRDARYTEDVTKAKIKMQLKKITHPEYKHLSAGEWDKYTAACRKIHEFAYKDDTFPDAKCSVVKDNEEIAITHNLFAVRDDDEEDSDSPQQSQKESRSTKKTSKVDDERAGTGDAKIARMFSFEGWPVSVDWKEEMMHHRDTLEIQPLVAYRNLTTDKIIIPSQYALRLPGAIVKVTVSIICYKFGSHAMSMAIEELRICVPPISLPTSPSKKRFRTVMLTPSSSSDKANPDSPTKKAKRL